MGIKRFLERVWNLYVNYMDDKKNDDKNKEALHALEILRHRTIKKVSYDIENVKFNTAISAMMEYVNGLYEFHNEGHRIPKEHFKTLAILLSPFAPHICEEI
jgi:leucyl-tRNA synthetase